jgi:propanol-preferring alcohol dehydrogenase
MIINGYYVTKPKSDLIKKQKEIAELKEDEILIKVEYCAFCRTDLHVIDGEIDAKYPIIPGHQIVGYVVDKGFKVDNININDKVGVYWLYSSCLECKFCKKGLENLCDNALFTGFNVDGGYADYIVAKKDYIINLSNLKNYNDYELAPMLCGGIIGYRAFRFIQDKESIGIYGLGSSGHIISQIVKNLNKRLTVFIKRNDKKSQELALSLGINEIYYSDEIIKNKLEGIIIFAPVGELVKYALMNLEKGGSVICAGIHMSDIPSFEYKYLWEERNIKSVANVTRNDAFNFFDIISKIPKINIHYEIFDLTQVNKVIKYIRESKLKPSVIFKI